MNKYLRFVLDRNYRFSVLSSRGIYNIFDDKSYIEKKYYSVFNRHIDWDNPQTFNEKLQWLKINNRKPEYTIMVDKYLAKKYVANIIGEQYIIPTIGVYNDFSKIDFSKLPDKFVIKTTHDSGGVVICKDKAAFDINKTKDIICKSLKRNYYYSSREWPYKDVEPRIIIEKFMEDDAHPIIDNWKFLCSKGELFAYYITKGGGHSKNLTLTYFDKDDNKLNFRNSLYPIENGIVEIPKAVQEMKNLASVLSKDIPFVRVDFYIVNDCVYFGELTFFPDSGFSPFVPDEADYFLGKKIIL